MHKKSPLHISLLIGLVAILTYASSSVGSQFLGTVVIGSLRFGPTIIQTARFIQPDAIDFTKAVESYSSPRQQLLSKQYFTFRHEAAPAMNYNYAKQIGLYLTANSVSRTDFFNSILDTISSTDASAIVIDVKGTNVYFDAGSAELAHELGRVRPLYDLPAIVQQAHERGIYVIARYIAVKDPSLAVARPETQVYNPNTSRSIGSLWVDPSHETVLRYNEEIIREVAIAGVDEINLDYIRFGTEVPNYMVGLTGEQKADKLMEFIKMARRTIDSYGYGTKLGVSTYAILGWSFPINFEVVGQDIARYAEYVDVISPMAYPSTFAVGSYYNPSRHPISRNYYLVYRTLEGYKDLLQPEDHKKLRPWIQGYSMLPTGMKHQMQAVYDVGLCGFTVWSAGNVYGNTITGLDLVDRPLHCR